MLLYYLLRDKFTVVCFIITVVVFIINLITEKYDFDEK